MEKPRIINAEEAFSSAVDLYVEKYGDVGEYAELLDCICSELKHGSKVADIACGPGNLSKYLRSKTSGLEFDFFDVSQPMLDYCESQFPGSSTFKKDMLSISNADKEYDAILCGFGIPYIGPQESRQFIENCHLLLRSSGLFYLSFMEEPIDGCKMVTSSNGDFSVATYFYSYNSVKNMLNDSGYRILSDLRIERENSMDTCILALKT